MRDENLKRWAVPCAFKTQQQRLEKILSKFENGSYKLSDELLIKHYKGSTFHLFTTYRLEIYQGAFSIVTIESMLKDICVLDMEVE